MGKKENDESTPTPDKMLRRVLRLLVEYNNAQRVIRETEVAHRTGLSASTIRNRCTASHPSFDPEFPKPKCLGSGKNRAAVGWLLSDIIEWMNSRPTAYLTGQLNKRTKAAKNARGQGADTEDFQI